jgi:glycosyltransferase involved in cell wall biosynthesis
MKILFFIQSLGIGGVESQIQILAEHLSHRGHNVSVLALYTVDQKWKFVWKLDSDIRSLILQEPRDVLSKGINLINATLELRSLLKRENFQLLYSFSGPFARFISWLATRGIPNTKLIWGVRGSGNSTKLCQRNWNRFLLFLVCKWISASVPIMISNSETGYNNRKASGYRCQKQLVINNGFDVERFKPDPEARTRVRSGWGIKDEQLIGIVARLTPSKGHPIFLEAVALLAKEQKDVRFVVVGDGSDRKRLELLGCELGLTESLIWAGARKDMPAVYNALDILCSSSYGEGFPNVIGEAMACGVPCVVTDVGDAAKIVGNDGIVVPAGDPQALAKGLRTMLLRLHDVKPLRLRQRIVRHFSIEIMVETTEKILAEACGSFK